MTSILQYARMAGACAIITLLSAGQIQAAAEPSMAEYTHFPIFQTGAVAPRVMIVLDNSGSMNFPAYGDGDETWPSGRTIATPYEGRVCEEFSGRVSSGTDDGQQQKNTGEIILCNNISTLSMLDIDLGKDDDTYSNKVGKKYVACSTQQAMLAGMRFANVAVPPKVDGVPVVVSKAYIEFTARASDGGNTFKKAALQLKITAQAADNPPTLNFAVNNISARPDTAASVTWDVPGVEWVSGQTYTTPDLTTIVQELVNRPGWSDGQAMLFKIDYVSGSGGRTVHSFDSNANLAPRLVIEYEPCKITTYYGYFDPKARYSYGTGVFVRDASGPWDGNFLNFISMRRGDVLRKAVVGGLSTSRTGGGNATQIGITENTSTSGDFRRRYSQAGVSPWSDAWYFITNGDIVVRASDSWSAAALGTFKIKVEKDPILEPNDFGPDGELAGVLQKVGDRAEWGNAYFLDGSDLTKGKGEISYAIGSNMTNMTTTMKNKAFSTNTPLSEVLYVVTQYFKQQDAEISGYPTTAIGPFNDTKDPLSLQGRVILSRKTAHQASASF